MMKRFVWIYCLLFVFLLQTKAQINKDAKFQYYIELKGADSKTTIKTLETAVRAKATVVLLTGQGVPRSFYLLETKTAVTKEEFSKWIGTSYTISKFEASKYTQKDFIKLKKKHTTF